MTATAAPSPIKVGHFRLAGVTFHVADCTGGNIEVRVAAFESPVMHLCLADGGIKIVSWQRGSCWDRFTLLHAVGTDEIMVHTQMVLEYHELRRTRPVTKGYTVGTEGSAKCL